MFLADRAPRRVAILGADTPVGVVLLDMLGRSPLIDHIAVLKCASKQWSTHQPEFWPRSAAVQQVNTRDVTALTAALRGLDTLYWTFPGHSVRDAHAITLAAKAAGVSHLSVVTSTPWGTTRSESVRRVEAEVRRSGMARVSIFRPRLLLLPESKSGPRGREMELEAHGGLRQAAPPCHPPLPLSLLPSTHPTTMQAHALGRT